MSTFALTQVKPFNKPWKYGEIDKTGMKVSNLSYGASSFGGHSLKEKEGINSVILPITGYKIEWCGRMV
ncbi:hypothetical protein RYH73_18680 [Olivibacter sp. CPCC 100613]|uniref:hypothetical protein n=1 Tax=Olivibacter sp. CPCC 100613 TaxID=3079931 RepID=UPI002FF83DA4